MNILQSITAFLTLQGQSKWVVWPLVTPLMALIALAIEREILFEENLFDMEHEYADIQCSDEEINARTADGRCNSLENPAWGMANIRFGRNVDPAILPATVTDEDIITPNPRTISRELMTRDEFIPAESINVLATAWIQFMVHDWFSHGKNQRWDPIRVPVAEDDPDFKREMRVQRTRRDQTYDGSVDDVITYQNTVTHWWDGSQIYGSDMRTQKRLRTFRGGKMLMRDGRLPKTFLGKVRTGFNDNWWVGLTLFHNIFVREHNRIADMLAATYPNMNDQELFDKARLINSALMAKIHTVEWTPALLDNPVLIQGMNSNWYGLNDPSFAGLLEGVAPYAEQISYLFGASEPLDVEKMGAKAMYGMAGGPTDHYDVPFTITEEFVSVYRMHPLLPDDFSIRNVEDDSQIASLGLNDVRERKAGRMVSKYGFDNIWYSFGTEHPGALTLNNFPKALQNVRIPLVGKIDLAAIDIIRDRERAVLRYNDFRRAIRLDPIDEFENLFKRFPMDPISEEHQALADKLREIYGTVDQLDVLTGSLAETVRPSGFAFGETSFQIFTLMASRRILSDRFFTEDYNPEMYTPEGYDIVETRTMTDIIKDHFPELAREGLIPENAFKPWGI